MSRMKNRSQPLVARDMPRSRTNTVAKNDSPIGDSEFVYSCKLASEEDSVLEASSTLQPSTSQQPQLSPQHTMERLIESLACSLCRAPKMRFEGSTVKRIKRLTRRHKSQVLISYASKGNTYGVTVCLCARHHSG